MQSDDHECNYIRNLVCFGMVARWILRFLTYFNILLTRLEKMNSGPLDTYNLLYRAFILTESDSDILSNPFFFLKIGGYRSFFFKEKF